MRSLVTTLTVAAALVAGSTAQAAPNPPAPASPIDRAAAASVVLGSTAADHGSCTPQGGGNITIVPVSTPIGGPVYAAAGSGVLTSFDYAEANVANADTLIRAVLVRPAAGGYTVVAKSAPVRPVVSQTTTYPLRLPAHAGDILAFSANTDTIGTACYSTYDGTSVTSQSDIGSVDTLIVSAPSMGLPNISAVLEPDADGDGYGDISQDGCPTAAGLQSACPFPDTIVAKKPPRATRARKAKISFRSDVPGVTFLCTLDFKAPKPCSSPLRVRAGLGKHRLLIQAVAAAYGTSDLTPATVTWKVRPRPRD